MNTDFEPDTILLYWSGELSREEAEEVERTLSSNPEARKYFEELEGMREEISSIPRELPGHSMVPQISSLVRKDRARKWQRLSLVGLASAAVILSGLFLLSQSDPTPTTKETEVVTSTPQAKLSDRLFASASGTPYERIRIGQGRAAELRNRLDAMRN